jgi:hypothetical protein
MFRAAAQFGAWNACRGPSAGRPSRSLTVYCVDCCEPLDWAVRFCDDGLCDGVAFFEPLAGELPAFAARLALVLSDALFAAAAASLAVEVARDCAPDAALFAVSAALLVLAPPLADPLAFADPPFALPLAPKAALELEEAPFAVDFAVLAVALASECAPETVSRAVFIAPLVSPLALTVAPTLAELPTADPLALPPPESTAFGWPDVDWLLDVVPLEFGAVLLLVVFLLACAVPLTSA